jgi:putative ABC transport system permease protein
MNHDVRYAVRTLLKARSFTVVAIVTLALGIGANTAIFSVVNGVLLRPLPYPAPDRIAQIWSTSNAEQKSAHSPADFLDFQRGNRTLLHLAGYREDALTLTTPAGDAVRVPGAQVTVDYFDVFGLPAALGRTFGRGADATSSEPLIVLSRAAWVEQFGSDPQIITRRVRVNGVPHTVVGVMPAAFDYPEGARAWVLSSKPVPDPPIDVPGVLLESRDVHYFQAVGRLRPGVTLANARADLAAIAAEQTRRFPESNGGRGVAMESLHDRIVGDVRGALLLLLGAVGVVLLIACANVASLVLARGSGRQREMAVRAALGAGRGRLIRQLVTESLILGLAGGLAGLLVGSWAIGLLLSIIPEGIPRAHGIVLDLRVGVAAIVVALISAVLFGLVPALQTSRVDTSLALREADRAATTGRQRSRTRAVLVVGEIALTIVLLVSAGLLARSFVRLHSIDPGFRVDRLTLTALPIPLSKYPDGKRQAGFYQRVLEAVQERPEVQSAAILFPNPIQGAHANGTFTIERHAAASRADRPFAALGSVSSDYFQTLGIPIIAGRAFTTRDHDPSPAVAIVNAALVRRYFAGEPALGKRFRFGDSADDWITIVGIAADSRNLGLNEPPSPLVYLPYHTFPVAFMSIAVRSSAAPGTVAAIVRGAVKKIDPDTPVDDIRSMRDVIEASIAQPRFRTLLLGLFAAVAVALAAVGVYGLMSFAVAQRRREIGIRVALGAQPRQVMLPIVREGMQVAAIGALLGIAGSLALTRLLAGFLFGVQATDPLTYAAMLAALLAIAFLATWIPSRRAMRLDPVTALRG